MFAAGETVFLSCVARGCAASGRNFALYQNGINLGQSSKLSAIYNFDSQHAGTYTCRPIPPQNVQSPGVTLALGCEYKIFIVLMDKKKKNQIKNLNTLKCYLTTVTCLNKQNKKTNFMKLYLFMSQIRKTIAHSDKSSVSVCS